MRKFLILLCLLFPVLASAQYSGSYIPRSEKGQPSGVATLDGSGKLPTAQMPVGDVTYSGNWNASTNTPTLADGVGTAGDLYITDVAGTQNLGGGSVAYGVGDWVIYDGTAWDRVPAAGAAPANPSVMVGLTAKNGTAPTFMRSDAAPAIDQSITPTWTGAHAFASNITVGGNAYVAGQLGSANNTSAPSPTNSGVTIGGAPTWAMASFYDAASPANGRTMDMLFISGALKFRFANDARSAFLDFLSISGTQAGVTGIASTSGSGAWAHTGAFDATTVTASGSNNITLTGATSGNSPTISTAGGNSDVGLTVNTKGSGGIVLNASTSVTGDVAVSGAITAGSGTIRAYSAAGVQVTTPHIVTGTVTLASGNGTATFTGNAVFSNTNSFVCAAVNTTTNSAVRATNASASSVTFNSGAGTDVIAYQCIGN